MTKLASQYYYNGAIDPIDRPRDTTIASRPDWCICCLKRRPLPIVFPNWLKKYGWSRYTEDYYWQNLCGPCDELLGIL